jgi:hypothetical protein
MNVEPTNKAIDAFDRLVRLMSKRNVNVVEWAMLTAMVVSATRQMYLREVQGQTREDFERDLLEMSYHMDAFVVVPAI